MKTVFSLSQIMSQNEPKLAHLIGTLALICATLAAIPVTLSSAGLAIPAVLVTISGYALTAGTIIKLLSKGFGVVDESGAAVNPNPSAVIPSNTISKS